MKSHPEVWIEPGMTDEVACLVAALGQASSTPFVESPEARGALWSFIEYAVKRRRKSGAQSSAPKVQTIFNELRRALMSKDAASLDLSVDDLELLRRLETMSDQLARTYGFTLQNAIVRVWRGESSALLHALQDFCTERRLADREEYYSRDESSSFSLESIVSGGYAD